MGYIMLGITIVVSAIALRFWLDFFARRAQRFKLPTELADLSAGEADLVGVLLPKPARKMWNFLVATVCYLALGLPHHLVIWNFWRHPEIDPWLYAHYVWTLGYWIGVIAVYAFILARNRDSQGRWSPSRR